MTVDSRSRHLVAVLVLIERAGAILLVQSRFPDAPWGLPGGLLEVGETVAQAAAREALEETGLVIQPGRPIGFTVSPASKRSPSRSPPKSSAANCYKPRLKRKPLSTSPSINCRP